MTLSGLRLTRARLALNRFATHQEENALTRTHNVCLLLFACWGMSACSLLEDDGDAPEVDGNLGVATVLHPLNANIATYNAGLAPGIVPLSIERAPETLKALAALKADLLCVQELWPTADMNSFKAAVTSRWPNAVVPPPQPSPVEAPCGVTDIQTVQMCWDMCEQSSPTDVASCLRDNCGGSVDCVDCVASNVLEGRDTVRDRCTSYAYEGSFGSGIFTQGDIVDQDVLVLESVLSRRAVIYAQVKFSNDPPVDVFCTHLTSDAPSIPYPGSSSWKQEQSDQIEAMFAFIQSKKADRGIIVLGDLNTGPATANQSAQEELPDHYQKLIDAGLTDPYSALPDATCTYCEDNPLVQMSISGTSSLLIDHILFWGLENGATHERVLLDPIMVEEAGKGPQTVAYSDHYGLLAHFGTQQ